MPGIRGRLADLVSDRLCSEVEVTEVRPAPGGFVSVTFSGPELRGQSWTPGAKVQLRTRRGTWDMRTYTPVSWDADDGATRVLAYVHGDGPAARWFANLAPGDPSWVFGPRRSIDLSVLSGPVLFAGDESSAGLAVALGTAVPAARPAFVFEATDAAGLSAVLDGEGLAADVGSRDTLLARLRSAAEAVDGEASVVVTGDAKTVHAVRRDVKTWPRPPKRVLGKAYWAEGRTGLD